MPGFRRRLAAELRPLAPDDVMLRVRVPRGGAAPPLPPRGGPAGGSPAGPRQGGVGGNGGRQGGRGEGRGGLAPSAGEGEDGGDDDEEGGIDLTYAEAPPFSAAGPAAATGAALAVWRGGSILGSSPAWAQLAITRAEYYEQGQERCRQRLKARFYA